MNIIKIIKILLSIALIILNIITTVFIYKKKKKYIFIPIIFNILILLIMVILQVSNKIQIPTINIFNFYKKTNKGSLTNDYELITQTEDMYNKCSFWRPKEKIINGILYKPLGDVDNFDIKNKPTKKSMLVPDNQTTKPIDYKLVFKNDTQKIYVWTPISDNGYKCMGDIITNTFEKPSLDLIRCVPDNWVREVKYISDVSPYNTESGSIWIGSYENSKYANLLRGSNTSKNSLSPVYEFI